MSRQQFFTNPGSQGRASSNWITSAGRAMSAWCSIRVFGALTRNYTYENYANFRKIPQNRQFFYQSARLGKVEITSRASSDLKI